MLQTTLHLDTQIKRYDRNRIWTQIFLTATSEASRAWRPPAGASVRHGPSEHIFYAFPPLEALRISDFDSVKTHDLKVRHSSVIQWLKQQIHIISLVGINKIIQSHLFLNVILDQQPYLTITSILSISIIVHIFFNIIHDTY